MASPDATDYEDLTGYAAARREELGPPPGFRMYGETFVGEPVLRGSSILDLVASDDPKIVIHRTFLQAQLTADSWTRFEVLFRDRDRPVDDGMVEVAVWRLIEMYAGRPTTESSSSPPTRSKSGKSSKVDSRPRKAAGLRSA